MKTWLTKFLPGIRMQLTLLIFLVILILLIVLTLWLIDRQNSTIRRELASQTEPILEVFKNILLEQNQLERSLAQMESMREKIRKVPNRKSYYDQYFSEKYLQIAEREIRSQLRSADGTALSEEEAAAFINARKKIITAKINRREELNWNPASWLSEGLIREVRQVKYSIRTTRGRNIEQERQAIRNNIQAEGRDKLGLFNFDSSQLRMQAFDPNGEILFDTATLEKYNLSPVNRLNLNEGEHKKNYANFLQVIRDIRKKVPGAIERLSEIENLSWHRNSKFADSFHTLHYDEESSTRAKILINVLTSQDKAIQNWLQEYEQQEEQIISQLRSITEQLRFRLAEIKQQQPKMPPYKDKLFRDTYLQYNNLIKQKKHLAHKIIPIVNPYIEELRKNEAQQAQSRQRIADLKKSLASLKKVKHQENNFDNEKNLLEQKQRSIQKDIEDENENLNLLQEKAKLLKYRSENWNYAREEFLRDSFENLADAYLYNQIILRYRYDSLALRDYLHSPQERENKKLIWATIRNWIYAAQNELNPPTKTSGKFKVPLFKNALLAKHRLEAEEQMWFIDTASTRELAHKILYEDNYAGFIRFTADLTEYQNIFEAERNRLTYLLLAIGSFGALLAFLLSSVFVTRIRRVSEQAAQVGLEGNLDIRFSQKGWDEISLLQKSLNQMLSSLKAGEEVRSQMHAASEVQKRLLPEKLSGPLATKLDTAMLYRAMSNIGGDYYDIIPSGTERLAICIGDVSNHGIGPALIMSNLSAQIKLLVNLGITSPRKILLKLNELLVHNTPEDMFVTFFLSFYDFNNKLLYWSCAGHNDGILVRTNGNLELLQGGGLPLGMDENESFLPALLSNQTQIQKGDLFFLFTDGLTEAKNAEKKFYGIERLKNILKTNHHLNCYEILQNIVQDLAIFTNQNPNALNLDDDIAMIAIKF